MPYKYSTDSWEYYLTDIGLPEEIVKEYLIFVDNFLSQDLPPIFEINHLSLLTGREPDDLYSYAYAAENFYRTFRVKKRSSGYRKISTPLPSLLEVQKWILTEILEKIQISKYAFGFVKKRSILDNARLHCGRNELLKIDIVDFFPSIDISRIITIFQLLGYPNNVSLILAKLCCLDDCLPQGAATSPYLSNLVCRRLDERFYRFCKSNNLRYTRYADDISISGDTIDKSKTAFLLEIIEDEGFEINRGKFLHLRSGDRKVVTGIDITNGTPRLPRSYRRSLMQDVYFVWSAGLSTHLAREKIFNPNYLDRLYGQLQFWKMVEPDNPQMIKTLTRLQQIQQLIQVTS